MENTSQYLEKICYTIGIDSRLIGWESLLYKRRCEIMSVYEALVLMVSFSSLVALILKDR
ncbi:putative holin-like toxin [Paraliobacillus ryukyuensis]|uniref:putative holin-like toxin n=1 Tax=Paraliobacillus ryukyuensis TaxID=200904 RepID=UPI00351D140A